MELRQLLTNVKTRLRIILVAGGLFTIAGWFISSNWPVSYTAALTLYVQKDAELSESGDYTYDGYYAQQASEAYTDTVHGLIQSPELMGQVLDALKIGHDTSTKAYVRSLTAEKIAPQIILVEVTRPTPDESREIVSTMAEVVGQRVDAFGQNGRAIYNVESVDTEPLVTENRMPVLLVTILSGLFGVATASLFAVTEVYVRSEDE